MKEVFPPLFAQPPYPTLEAVSPFSHVPFLGQSVCQCTSAHTRSPFRMSHSTHVEPIPRQPESLRQSFFLILIFIYFLLTYS